MTTVQAGASQMENDSPINQVADRTFLITMAICGVFVAAVVLFIL